MGCSVREVGDKKSTLILYVKSLTMGGVLIMLIVRVMMTAALVSIRYAGPEGWN
jgi:hypothetical protein